MDPNGNIRSGRVFEAAEDVTCIEVFRVTTGLDTKNPNYIF